MKNMPCGIKIVPIQGKLEKVFPTTLTASVDSHSQLELKESHLARGARYTLYNSKRYLDKPL